MPWLHSLDGTTCAVPLKGRFKEALFRAPVGQKPCGKGAWQPKGTSPVILPMDAGITRAKPSRAEKAAMVRGMREPGFSLRSEEHTSELQSHVNLVCRLLLEKK